MNRILTCSLATMFVPVFTPTVFADKDGHGGHGGGGGHVGGGGAPRASAPAQISSASRMSVAPRANTNVMRAPSGPRVATQAQTQFRQAPRSFTPSVTRSQRINNSPSVAFGGHVIDNNASVNTGTRRSFATTPSTQQQFTTRRGDTRDFRVPLETSRDWDRGRVHEWNRHHYRFSGGTWVIIDPGIYDYGYGGYYDSDEPVTYSSPGYAYDSGSLAMSAQDRLTRLGYSPGPVDGVIGPQTRDAIADFQNDNRLPVTGNLDTATVRALGL